MNNRYIGDNFCDVYRRSLNDLVYNFDFKVAPRGLVVKEQINTSLVFNPKNFIFENKVKSSNIDYINGELEWYFSGRNDLDFISKYSKFWNKISNEDGTCNSAYGKLIFKDKNKYGFTQYDWALKQIAEDLYTRKSIMFFNNKDFQYDNNKDFICTNYVMFLVRENKLFMNVHMRSNDAILGTINDVAFFSILYQQFLRHLNTIYKNLKVGVYSHTVDSFHLYENKFSTVCDMLRENFINKEYELDYDIINKEGEFVKFKKIIL